jgi:hypothetical protein
MAISTLSALNAVKSKHEKAFKLSAQADLQKVFVEYLRVLKELAHRRLLNSDQEDFALLVGELRAISKILDVLDDGDETLKGTLSS